MFPFAGTNRVFGLMPMIGPEAELDANRLTLPVNPFSLDTVITDLPVEVVGNVRDVGFDETVNPTTLMGTVSVPDTDWPVALRTIE